MRVTWQDAHALAGQVTEQEGQHVQPEVKPVLHGDHFNSLGQLSVCSSSSPSSGHCESTARVFLRWNSQNKHQQSSAGSVLHLECLISLSWNSHISRTRRSLLTAVLTRFSEVEKEIINHFPPRIILIQCRIYVTSRYIHFLSFI